VTTPPDARQTPDGRFYVFNENTDAEERFRSVTAVLGRIDKPPLLPWSAGLAADIAFGDTALILDAQLTEECQRTYIRCEHEWTERCPQCPCGRCEPCVRKRMRNQHFAEMARRADEGTRVHEALRVWLTTREWPAVDQDIALYVAALQAMIDEYRLVPDDWELIEATVISRTHGYAGTLDGILNIVRGRSTPLDDLLDRFSRDGTRLDSFRLLLDLKSRQREVNELYEEHPLQLSAYRHADVVRLPDGTEVALPRTDGAAILLVTQSGAQIRPVLAEQEELEAFLTMLKFDAWCLDRGKRAIGARTFAFTEDIAKARARDAARRRRLEAAEASPEASEPAVAPEPEVAQVAVPTGVTAEQARQRLAAGLAEADRTAADALERFREKSMQTGEVLRGLADQHGTKPRRRATKAAPAKAAPARTLHERVLGVPAPAKTAAEQPPPF